MLVVKTREATNNQNTNTSGKAGGEAQASAARDSLTGRQEVGRENRGGRSRMKRDEVGKKKRNGEYKPHLPKTCGELR